MAVTVKRLEVTVGDDLEIDGHKYDIVPERAGAVALEPAIMSVSVEGSHDPDQRVR